MKILMIRVLLLFSLVLIYSCGKDSNSPTGSLEDTYTITGVVNGVDSVTVSISGDASASWLVNKSGDSYSFTVTTGGTYIITPSKTGYSFTPPNKTFKNLSKNQIQNFDAKQALYTLSGTVSGADNVTIVLSGDLSATWTINNGETYSFDVPAFGSYTITPYKSEYVFIPANMSIENVVENHLQDFEAKSFSSFPILSNSIVFYSSNREEGSIFIMNIDGTNERPVPNIGRNVGSNPSWSPDGRFIAFSYISKGMTSEDIYITDVNGSILINLTNSPNLRELSPSWSPDGSKIAFSSSQNNTSELYMINSDGTGRIKITNLGGHVLSPSWSPNNQQIIFTHYKTDNPNIYIINIDGTGLKELTYGDWNSYPSWSPDGLKVVYNSQVGNKFDIFTMNSDGTNIMNLTNNPNYSYTSPSWTPDGLKIVFQSDDIGHRQLYIINVDGTDQQRITNNNYEYFSPECSKN